MSDPLHAQMACVWEATARKPGNVHRYRDFGDTTYLDFVASAAAIGPVVVANLTVGEVVLEGVRATRLVTNVNTNIGILLLLAPLAVAEPEPDLSMNLERVLASLTREDSRRVYEAIRLVNPGGLGKVDEGSAVGFSCGAGDNLIFSGAHFHRTRADEQHGLKPQDARLPSPRPQQQERLARRGFQLVHVGGQGAA